MAGPIQTCLRRPVGVSVGVLLTVLAGTLALVSIPIQLTPNVDTPIINVETAWPGANPQEVEREIVDQQEEQLRSVKGLRQMTSTSRDGSGGITLEYYTGVDKNEALREVTDKLRQVRSYPLEVRQPTVTAADTSRDSEIAWLILRAKEGKGEQLTELYTFTKDFVKPYLDRVKGVASTDIYGGREKEIQVRVDLGRLAARGLLLSQVADALRHQNMDVSAGTRPQGKREFAVRTLGQYRSTGEIMNTVVAYTSGGPVYVRDVGEVVSSFKKQNNFVRSSGRYTLAFPVRREVGANVIEVMQGLREAVRKVNAEVLAPRNLGLELVQIYDETVYIDQSIGMVRESAIVGSALTIAVLMLFLRNWRPTLAVALAIPISVIGSFVVLALFGRTLNVISLAGIAFAIGMVVDDAIVVLENIYRHREMGKSPSQASYDGVKEVWSAVLASTLTTQAVFIPVMLVQEEAGQLFRDISVAIVAAMGLSLLVAVLVIPPLAQKLLSIGGKGGGKVGGTGGGHAGAGPKASLVGNIAAGLFDRFGRRGLSRFVLITALAFGSLWGAWALIPNSTYLPTGNRNLVFGALMTPPGYSVAEFKSMADAIESRISPYWTVKAGSPEQQELDRRWVEMVQGMLDKDAIPELADPSLSWLERDRIRREWLTPPPLMSDFFFVTFNGFVFMGATSADPARVKPLTRLLQTAGMSIPGVYCFFSQMPLFRESSGNTVELQIRGDDLDKVVAAGSTLFGTLLPTYGFIQSDPQNFSLGRPEVQIRPDRERAADIGLTVADVGTIVESCVDGAYVGDYRPGGSERIDISLIAEGQQALPTQLIGQAPIFTPSGKVVPLTSLVQLTDTTSLEVIKRIERQRAVSLTISPPETRPLEAVITDVKATVEKLREAGAIDPSVMVTFSGNADKLRVARNVMIGEWKGWTPATLISLLSGRFGLSVLICYLLLVALYESWLYPFVIMFSVPLAVFGGFLGLYLCQLGTLLSTNQPVQQLDVLTFLGFVILVGTVVKNAILLVDQSLQNFRDHGMSVDAAIREATRARTRPVLMTSLTTFFGLLPLAVIPGAGSELYRGLAAVCAGGMLVSTLGTLVLIPAVMTLALRFDARRVHEFIADDAAGAASAALGEPALEAPRGAAGFAATPREP